MCSLFTQSKESTCFAKLTVLKPCERPTPQPFSLRSFNDGRTSIFSRYLPHSLPRLLPLPTFSISWDVSWTDSLILTPLLRPACQLSPTLSLRSQPTNQLSTYLVSPFHASQSTVSVPVFPQTATQSAVVILISDFLLSWRMVLANERGLCCFRSGPV